MLKHLRTVLVLGRMSNLPTVWTNVLAGWFLAGGAWSGELWWLMAGVSLLYVGGMTLNDAFDVEWDKKHAPQRPVPAGMISARTVWLLGWGQMLAGVGVLFGGTGVSWYFLLALVLAIVLYDWSHKKWKGAVLVMGACRFLVYVVAASAVGQVSFAVGIFATGLFFYVWGITLAARGESCGGKVSWMGKGLLIAPLLVVSGVMVMTGGQLLWGGAAVLVFILWLFYALRQLRSTRPDRIGKFVSVLLAGIILVDLMALAQFGDIFWLICGSLLLLTRLLQRWIPAT
ncbi:MAG: UbiA family prenyltransferase [Verrucomicrobiota bacterium]